MAYPPAADVFYPPPFSSDAPSPSSDIPSSQPVPPVSDLSPHVHYHATGPQYFPYAPQELSAPVPATGDQQPASYGGIPAMQGTDFQHPALSTLQQMPTLDPSLIMHALQACDTVQAHEAARAESSHSGSTHHPVSAPAPANTFEESDEEEATGEEAIALSQALARLHPHVRAVLTQVFPCCGQSKDSRIKHLFSAVHLSKIPLMVRMWIPFWTCANFRCPRKGTRYYTRPDSARRHMKNCLCIKHAKDVPRPISLLRGTVHQWWLHDPAEKYLISQEKKRISKFRPKPKPKSAGLSNAKARASAVPHPAAATASPPTLSFALPPSQVAPVPTQPPPFYPDYRSASQPVYMPYSPSMQVAPQMHAASAPVTPAPLSPPLPPPAQKQNDISWDLYRDTHPFFVEQQDPPSSAYVPPPVQTNCTLQPLIEESSSTESYGVAQDEQEVDRLLDDEEGCICV
ncbi:hypothetical protein BV25DRAFT_1902593 [Artomyces pyxidatus]|uniref:Uncharacterized protein n=1 Tax=Artomyces pyxidatus TaxID=48021 RepID=A0ACB8SN77_9AGAM|nr:hypothetical protein BV25DRAFT_1902593 [Artomyces pyxidatus]